MRGPPRRVAPRPTRPGARSAISTPRAAAARAEPRGRCATAEPPRGRSGREPTGRAGAPRGRRAPDPARTTRRARRPSAVCTRISSHPVAAKPDASASPAGCRPRTSPGVTVTTAAGTAECSCTVASSAAGGFSGRTRRSMVDSSVGPRRQVGRVPEQRVTDMRRGLGDGHLQVTRQHRPSPHSDTTIGDILVTLRTGSSTAQTRTPRSTGSRATMTRSCGRGAEEELPRLTRAGTPAPAFTRATRWSDP
jgi:hypothetical protein